MPRMRLAARLALFCLLLACLCGPLWAGTLAELKGRFEQEKDKDFITQYAILGLRHAARAGVSIPVRVWKSALEHWLATQNDDGGWGYVPQSKKDVSSSSMTAAGLSSLLICLENRELDAAERTPAEAALDRGFTALGTLMKLDKDSLYTLYGIERASVLGRRSSLAGKPWYAPGGLRILDEQGADGLWTGPYARPVDAAFAILFLKKATTPIAPVVTR